jgi:hypothetical protein
VTFTPPSREVTAPPGERPRWLFLGGAGTIVLGGLAALGGLLAPVSLAFGKTNPFAGMPGATPELAAMQEKLMASPALELTAVMGLANLVAGGTALWAGIRLVSEKPEVRRLFRRAVLWLLLAECLGLSAGLFLQIRSWDIMQELGEALARSSTAPPGLAGVMKKVMLGSTLLGLAITVVWGSGKIAFLTWARGYTGRDEVARYLDGIGKGSHAPAVS